MNLEEANQLRSQVSLLAAACDGTAAATSAVAAKEAEAMTLTTRVSFCHCYLPVFCVPGTGRSEGYPPQRLTSRLIATNRASQLGYEFRRSAI